MSREYSQARFLILHATVDLTTVAAIVVGFGHTLGPKDMRQMLIIETGAPIAISVFRSCSRRLG